jgi:hypothetical protein
VALKAHLAFRVIAFYISSHFLCRLKRFGMSRDILERQTGRGGAKEAPP